jgi:glycosyltransferase involved in cell wall biosynthesis
MYDFIYLTNLPAFYKINLFNSIAKEKKILIIFTHSNHSHRTDDFFKGDREFNFISIADITFFRKIYLLLKLLKVNDYDKLIIGGWDQFLFWIVVFLNKKSKNSIVIESSIYESKVDGLKGVLKKIFLSRISKAYCSGQSQSEIVKQLNFKGKIIITNGVGLINIIDQPIYTASKKVTEYVYIGRFSKEKNLSFLVKVFNNLPHLNLHLIGYGYEEVLLREISNPNIIFHGEIFNKNISKILQEMHVFVLPSISEPWGLVVEEALNNGLPVIVSNKVGCAYEFVSPKVGMIFDFNKESSLIEAITKMSNINFYNQLRFNISKLNFSDIANQQIQSYL